MQVVISESDLHGRVIQANLQAQTGSDELLLTVLKDAFVIEGAVITVEVPGRKTIEFRVKDYDNE